ncbi:exodeoxyribonuclease V subunit alpha [Nocardioides sp. Y6]|uniref:RecBCD enzyme subunit RecD n=1 Tax=Nocardioides malaquae TaxID=2773426 RepID=A0ABR9RR83_9ACTN|nr:exodeoxyribonuclease V subunit alpha [Nocardioides malaquae]MBE7324081.1 exodeoxyribonuclease V subunit alpha [Nocardioides malaquae]
MSDLFVHSGAHDPRLVLSEEGPLAVFNQAGVITAGDVHVARTLGAVGGERDPDVLLAVALTCRAVRSGSVCLDLAGVAESIAAAQPQPPVPAPETEPGAGPDPGPTTLPWPEAEAWADAVTRSPLVAAGVLRWSGQLLYLDRYHEQETQVLDDLVARAATQPQHDLALMQESLARVFPAAGYEEQREACLRAAHQWTTVITGGPGTGKTTAVAGLLVALHEQYAREGRRVRIALAAPTGKAAARLQEAVSTSTADFDAADRARLEGIRASTLHRLLGRHPGNSTRFRHHRGNRLPHDVVVVDETSMVSLTMMARLLEAVRPDARLVLVGDPDQLSSVEAGAVLGDLVEGYRDRRDSPVAALQTSHRFEGGITLLAAALRSDDPAAVLAVLEAGHPDVEWVRDQDPASTIRTVTVDAAQRARDHALAGDGRRAIDELGSHRLLCAHRDGPFGVTHWNRRIERWLSEVVGDPLLDPFYVGRPLLVTSNDYSLGIYNGDSGVVVQSGAQRRVVIDSSEGLRDFAPSRMSDVETMHAMTIHKAQGSQAREVTVLLPPEDSRLLTRELFYTAVTRARAKVRVIGSEAEVRAAVARTAQRASGLSERLRADADAGHGHVKRV